MYLYMHACTRKYMLFSNIQELISSRAPAGNISRRLVSVETACKCIGTCTYVYFCICTCLRVHMFIDAIFVYVSFFFVARICWETAVSLFEYVCMCICFLVIEVIFVYRCYFYREQP